MKITTQKNKLSVFKILLPIMLLLVIVLLLNTKESSTEFISKDFNPYYKSMPNEYVSLIEKKTTINDSNYFALLSQKVGTRELLILKAFPTEEEKNSSFNVKVLGQNNTDYQQRITNKPYLYNYDEVTYGVIKTKLPFVNIKSIEIDQVYRNKKLKPWTSIIEVFPFKNLSVSSNNKESTYPILEEANGYQEVYDAFCTKFELKQISRNLIQKEQKLYRTEMSLDDYISDKKNTVVRLNNLNQFLIEIQQPAFEINESWFTEQVFNNISFKDYLNSYSETKMNLDSFLDLEKIFLSSALNKLFAVKSTHLDLVYNQETNKFEPLLAEFKIEGDLLGFIRKSQLTSTGFVSNLTSAYDEILRVDIQNDIISKISNFEDKIAQINSFNINSIFDVDNININQKVIAKSLYPSSVLKTELLAVNKSKLKLKVFNLSNYPVRILELNHLQKKIITELETPTFIASRSSDTVTFNLPRSFENLFVNKKTKQTGFVLEKHIYDLFLGYEINNSNKLFETIIPFQKTENIDVDLFREKTKLEQIPNIVINKERKAVTFSKLNIELNVPLVIPQGYKFTLKPGTKLDIKEGGKVISHGPLIFEANKDNPIYISTSDGRGQGFLVLAEGKMSRLRNVTFDGLRNLVHGTWNVTGAVTFYESPVKLFRTTVKNNHCEDALNVVRADFEMRNSRIEGTQSDAFDGDFVTGKIIDSEFYNLGNDAIDVSGSNILIKNVIVKDAKDKGLSAGEDSQMRIINVEVHNSEIAVAGKDLSIVDVENFKVYNTKLGFTAFQKKPEFGPSDIKVKNLKLEGVEMDYLIESSSSLYVDGKKIETSENVKDRMYGVEFGRSSAETRNIQQ